MMKKIFFSGIIITCIFRAQASLASVAGTVEKGNKLYYNQKYEDALKQYDQALSKQPDSTVINFDAGAAQYKAKEYQKANSSFEKSLITDDKKLESKANYNLGNSRYMLGLSQENTDLALAVQLLEGALNNYKRTQDLTPKDEDVKVNYKIVEAKLKELKEKLKQQPQENKASQQQQEQNKEEPQNRQGEGKQNQENGQEQKKAQEQKEQANQAQEQPAQQQDQGGQEKQKQQTVGQPPNQNGQSGNASAQAEESKEMSKEEANMLLEGYRQEEHAAGMLKDDRKGVEEKVLKDW
jgi:Ca-activated chloride channel family protein